MSNGHAGWPVKCTMSKDESGPSLRVSCVTVPCAEVTSECTAGKYEDSQAGRG